MTFAFLQMSASELDDASSGAWARINRDHDNNPATPPSQLSEVDREYLDALRAGDVEVFRKLFDTYYTTLARYARRFVQNAADTDEVIADVFLAVWNRRAQWNPQGGIAAYLFRAVRNRARNMTRDARTASGYLDRAARESAPGMGEQGIAPDQAIDIADRESRLWQVIETLPERSRLLLDLRWRSGLAPAQIATVLGISVTAVNTGMSRAIRLLRDLLPDDFQ